MPRNTGEKPTSTAVKITIVARSRESRSIAYSKRALLPDGRYDTVIVVVNLDPHGVREAMATLDLAALGMAPGERFRVTDEFTGSEWVWGESNYVRLDPFAEPAHLLTVHRM